MEEAIILLVGIFLRWCVSLYPYSGTGNPPMYGDYEAQRHWQEVTINLPIHQWYKNGTDNDLLYWGIDYPPLSAYHSYLCGRLAHFINPEYVALHTSRGYESADHKLFMRYLVFVTDIAIYFSATLFLCKTSYVKLNSRRAVLAALILYPGMYLIDYGHFQFNNISLGLFVFSIACYLQSSDLIGSVFFCFALNYKQMELYHALPIFFYLIGICLKQNSYFKSLMKLLKLGITVCISFAICWAPFLVSTQSAKEVLVRIFPLNRGLYEDKVASFWCSLNVLLKVRTILSISQLAVFCLCATMFFSLPSCIHLMFNPTRRNLKYSLFNVSMAFFMFSFHVHEKSILLAVIPAALLFDQHPLSVVWFMHITTLSMFPLLVKDGLAGPTLLLLLITYLLYHMKYAAKETDQLVKFMGIIYSISTLSLFLLCLSSLIFSPPSRYPDLYPVVISGICFFKYFNFYIYFNYCQYGESTRVKKD